jgi:hypothetical protein
MPAVPRVELEEFNASQSLHAICRSVFDAGSALKLLELLRVKTPGPSIGNDSPTVFVLDVSGVRKFDTSELSKPLQEVFDHVKEAIGHDVILVNNDSNFDMFIRAFRLGSGMNIHVARGRPEITPKLMEIRALSASVRS